MKLHHIDELWKCFYSAGPADGVADAAAALNASLVLGGEACIWGEGTNSWSIDTQTYTLAAAAAERFWSGIRDAGAPHMLAADRLSLHVCLMNTLGMRAAPVSTAPCLQALLY